MNHILHLLAALSLLAMSCSSKKDPQGIIDRSIEAHGGNRIAQSHIQFDFRNRHYSFYKTNGLFKYTREFTDTLGKVSDVLTNSGLVRFINGDTAKISIEKKAAYSNSVNSVIYFALLPYGLNDPAVRKTYFGETSIKNQSYYRIKITFDQSGGGDDHEDVFLYWINKDHFTVDYFAYSYHTDGGGIRFREAINRRTVMGVLFQDYINYKPKSELIPLDDLETLFLANKLERLSEINLENIVVQ